MSKKMLLMGPIPPAYTGQSVAFNTIATYIKEKNPVTIIDISNADSIINAIRLYLRISYYMLFNRYSVIYFTCSRSLFGSFKDFVLIFWARLTNTKVVNHLHGADFKTFYNGLPYLYKKMMKWTYSYINKSIVLLDGMEKEFSDFPNMKIEVIANGYTKDLDQCPLLIPEQPRTSVNLLYLSNLMVSKGIINLLKAMEVLFPAHPELTLTIAGKIYPDHLSSLKATEDEFNGLYQQLKKLYPHQIEYVGVCSGEPKRKLLWDSDVLILPTFYPTEALPLAIIEGMRTGNFIITCAHNYLPKVVKEENGVLIAPDSVDAIVNSVVDVCQHQDNLRRVQQYNIEHARQKYSEDAYKKSIWAVINN